MGWRIPSAQLRWYSVRFSPSRVSKKSKKSMEKRRSLGLRVTLLRSDNAASTSAAVTPGLHASGEPLAPACRNMVSSPSVRNHTTTLREPTAAARTSLRMWCSAASMQVAPTAMNASSDTARSTSARRRSSSSPSAPATVSSARWKSAAQRWMGSICRPLSSKVSGLKRGRISAGHMWFQGTMRRSQPRRNALTARSGIRPRAVRMFDAGSSGLSAGCMRPLSILFIDWLMSQ
mmetsp:Transcript_78825/g.222899  ORF Transcript_78825/g.222899 Transcript_78825/m.222899 type:complete len:233 (-) Transcript_78825:65-763(-)